MIPEDTLDYRALGLREGERLLDTADRVECTLHEEGLVAATGRKMRDEEAKRMVKELEASATTEPEAVKSGPPSPPPPVRRSDAAPAGGGFSYYGLALLLIVLAAAILSKWRPTARSAGGSANPGTGQGGGPYGSAGDPRRCAATSHGSRVLESNQKNSQGQAPFF